MEEIIKAILTGGGVAGAILIFHLWKLAPEMRAIWRAIDRRTRAELIQKIAAGHLPGYAKAEAEEICREIDEEEERGKKREVIPP